jgi:hypothetical protein
MPIKNLCSVAGFALVGVAVAGATLASGSAVAADLGVWQKHEYSFAFMGFTSTYSCDGLASKLKLLLIAAGARSDAKANAGACASGFGRPDKFARADLTFYTLAAVGPDNTVDGKPADGTPVAGSWIPVELSYQHPRELGRGDCELVEQFRSNVLPLFTTRNVDDHMTCIPYQESGSNIDLQFESFAVPPKAHPAQHG